MLKAKVELLARKIVFVKKHLKMAYFPLPESGFPDFWKALNAKSFWYDGSNELRGRLPLKFGCLWDGSGTIS